MLLQRVDLKTRIRNPMIESFRQIIEWWPTTRALAEDLGIEDAVVRQWKMRDIIPARYWRALLETKIARKHRLTAGQLTNLADWRPRSE
jgi:hypothetical protein